MGFNSAFKGLIFNFYVLYVFRARGFIFRMTVVYAVMVRSTCIGSDSAAECLLNCLLFTICVTHFANYVTI